MSISMKCFIDFSSLQSCYYRPTPCSRLITIQDRCKTSVLVMGKSQSRFEHIWDSTWGIMIRFEIMRFILWFYFKIFFWRFRLNNRQVAANCLLIYRFTSRDCVYNSYAMQRSPSCSNWLWLTVLYQVRVWFWRWRTTAWSVVFQFFDDKSYILHFCERLEISGNMGIWDLKFD